MRRPLRGSIVSTASATPCCCCSAPSSNPLFPLRGRGGPVGTALADGLIRAACGNVQLPLPLGEGWGEGQHNDIAAGRRMVDAPPDDAVYWLAMHQDACTTQAP